MKFQPITIKELLDWSYANLAAYQVALNQDPPRYTKVCWMTRSRVYKGLQTGGMARQSIYRNEREKLTHKNQCAYCGAMDVPLTLDHLFPRSKGGSDSGDNLVYCCQSCNSAKGNKDYFSWIQQSGRKVSIAVAERYLKNAYAYCEENGLLSIEISNASEMFPFCLKDIPLQYSITKEAHI